MAVEQPVLFPSDQDIRPMVVKIYKDGRRFLALIANGWWMAYGPTVRQAFKRVVKRYERERDYVWL